MRAIRLRPRPEWVGFAGGGHMDRWYDDPLFDDAEAILGGKRVRGDDWRRLQWLKETHGEGDLICSGTPSGRFKDC